jgi:2-C-methyl-D-erythritol 4-phosphate cytidylyltransferase
VKIEGKLPGARTRHKNKGGTLGVVIVAAGTSQRMTGVNKLFASLSREPVLAWSVDTCQRHRLVRQIVLVLNDKDLARGERLTKEKNWSKVTLCGGGARRQDSVKEGLRQLKDCDWVMIHDGARPFVTPGLIEEGLKIAAETGAAVAAVPVKDTIKVVDSGNFIKETPTRERLWAAQTPQIFDFDIITRAYENLTTEATDDSVAVGWLGHKVKLYMGDYQNIKVTTPEDLALARIIARKWKQKN